MVTKVEGANKGKLLLYALSTCIWCKKTKAFLDENNISYEYIFVDMLEPDEKDKIKEDIRKWNPDCSYPTLVINNAKCIIGYEPDKIKEELGL